jgi:hypothetical protein
MKGWDALKITIRRPQIQTNVEASCICTNYTFRWYDGAEYNDPTRDPLQLHREAWPSTIIMMAHKAAQCGSLGESVAYEIPSAVWKVYEAQVRRPMSPQPFEGSIDLFWAELCYMFVLHPYAMYKASLLWYHIK